jgi:hypothetical protein
MRIFSEYYRGGVEFTAAVKILIILWGNKYQHETLASDKLYDMDNRELGGVDFCSRGVFGGR